MSGGPILSDSFIVGKGGMNSVRTGTLPVTEIPHPTLRDKTAKDRATRSFVAGVGGKQIPSLRYVMTSFKKGVLERVDVDGF